jgi:hypothetical protein
VLDAIRFSVDKCPTLLEIGKELGRREIRGPGSQARIFYPTVNDSRKILFRLTARFFGEESIQDIGSDCESRT